jgi:magnesium-transporting ATPase (P-type)
VDGPTDRRGLSNAEASARLARDGPNTLPVAGGPSVVRQLVEQLVHLFALLLWVAAALALIAGLPELTVAIVVVIVVNALFAFGQ